MELTMIIRRGGALCVIMKILSWTFHVPIFIVFCRCFGQAQAMDFTIKCSLQFV